MVFFKTDSVTTISNVRIGKEKLRSFIYLHITIEEHMPYIKIAG